jgi:hypothetical protein
LNQIFGHTERAQAAREAVFIAKAAACGSAAVSFPAQFPYGLRHREETLMLTMIEDWVGVDNAPYVIWTGLALAALLLAALVFLLFRRSLSGTYVAGGRNRRPRLAVLDAAAIDAKRRLVLVRRDETEHLILIGGPTDVVVEAGIRPGGMPVPRQPGAPAQAAQPQQRRPMPQPQPTIQRPIAPPPPPVAVQAPAPAPKPQPSVTYSQPPMPAPPMAAPPMPAPMAPVAPPPAKVTARPAPAPAEPPLAGSAPPPPIEAAPEPKPAGSPFRRFFGAKTPPSASSEKELIEAPTKAASDEVDRSLEEEMTKLLEEISDSKK